MAECERRERRTYTDFYVTSSGETIPCHREVLAQASPVLERMLAHEMEEAREQRDEIDDAQPHAVLALITFTYTVELKCDDEHTVGVLSLLDRYQVKVSLIGQCVENFLASVNEDNVVLVARVFRNFEDKPDMKVLWETLLRMVRVTPSALSALAANA